MNAENLIQLLYRRPFVPFRIDASDGRTYDVQHADQALVLRTRVILPLPANGSVPERDEHLAVSHIVRAEELPADAAKSTG